MTVQPTSTNVPGALHVSVPDGAFAPVAAKMSTGTDQNVADLAVNALVLFDGLDYESAAGIVDLVNDRFVVPVSGVYLVAAAISWNGEDNLPVDSAFTIGIAINGNVDTTSRQTLSVGSGSPTPGTNQIANAYNLSAGDLVTIRVSQVSQAQRSLANAVATIQRVA